MAALRIGNCLASATGNAQGRDGEGLVAEGGGMRWVRQRWRRRLRKFNETFCSNCFSQLDCECGFTGWRSGVGGSGRWAESVTRKYGTFSMAADNSESPTSCVFVYVFCGFLRFFLRVSSSPLLLLLYLPCCCINFHINSYSLWLIIGVVIVIAVVIVVPLPPLPTLRFRSTFYSE